MLIITIRTDKPQSELGLFNDDKELSSLKWQAHLELAETIHKQVRHMLTKTGKKWSDISGVVIYEGPGSFTGLRIGTSFANSLAFSLNIPIVGSSEDDWIDVGINKLLAGKNDRSVVPKYGGEIHVSLPKK